MAEHGPPKTTATGISRKASLSIRLLRLILRERIPIAMNIKVGMGVFMEKATGK